MIVYSIIISVLFALVLFEIVYNYICTNEPEAPVTMAILLLLWELPQTLLGLIVFLFNFFVLKSPNMIKNVFFNEERTVWKSIDYTAWKFNSGLSLGQFIFVNIRASNNTLLHEDGHTQQSRLLGWLYLPVIGLPSFIWACLYKIPAINKRWSYYDFFSEKWADKLGGVRRK